MKNDLNLLDMTDNDYRAWLIQAGGVTAEFSDEAFANLTSEALRETNPVVKATMLVDAANMALHLADRTLGAKGTINQIFSVNLRKEAFN